MTRDRQELLDVLAKMRKGLAILRRMPELSDGLKICNNELCEVSYIALHQMLTIDILEWVLGHEGTIWQQKLLDYPNLLDGSEENHEPS